MKVNPSTFGFETTLHRLIVATQLGRINGMNTNVNHYTTDKFAAPGGLKDEPLTYELRVR